MCMRHYFGYVGMRGGGLENILGRWGWKGMSGGRCTV